MLGPLMRETMMNKYDWLEVGTRVIGVYLVAQGLLGALGATILSLDLEAEGILTAMIAAGLLSSFAGTCFVLLAPGFVGWLRGRDEQARSAARRAPASAAR